MTSSEIRLTPQATRRQFLTASCLACGAAALAGCSWTPRNASAPEASPDPTEENVEETPSEQAVTEAVEDGFVLVKGGTFDMGSPEDEPWRSDDEVLHEVTVDDFYLCPFEVTEREFERAMGGTGGASDLPVAEVSFYDAVTFANALSAEAGLTPAYTIEGEQVSWDLSSCGYRLPTEAEWEYACRAGTTGPFNTNTSVSADEANYYGHYPYEIEDNYFNQEALEVKPGTYRGRPIEVGSFEPNVWGLFDMHGNVAEWVWDRYGAYEATDAQNPTGPDEGALRVVRGGGWNDFAKNLRSAYRASLTPTSTNPSVGLRLSRSAQPRRAPQAVRPWSSSSPGAATPERSHRSWQRRLA